MIEQTHLVSCRGGLDLTTNSQELLSQPGLAIRLLNFEPSVDGGYRRINGFTTAGTLPEGGDTPIKGVRLIDNTYAVICHEDKVWITFDFTNYVIVNKTIDLSANAQGVNLTTLNDLPLNPRASSSNYKFSVFQVGTTITVIGVSAGHPPFFLQVNGTSHTDARYIYKELTISQGSLSGASYTEEYRDQLIIAGMDSAPTEIFYSDILRPDNFEGGNAGSIGMNDIIVGLKMFRETLYVFCRNSIHSVIGLETGSPQRRPVTTQIGCVNGDTIQEIAGDLVFLAPDGMRTLSATDRIDDVNLEGISGPIANRFREINRDIDRYDVRSVVLKNKIQYRCFFNPKPGINALPFSFIMYMGLGPQGLLPEYSEIRGFDVQAIDNDIYTDTERTLSGDSEGNLWWHDTGDTFNGSQITFLYQTPYFAIDDPEVRKNIHKIRTYLRLEGNVNFKLGLRFDYDNERVLNPPPYEVRGLNVPSIYGQSRYNRDATYGNTEAPAVDVLTEGSGKVVSIRIFPTNADCASFSLQGYLVSYVPSGRI